MKKLTGFSKEKVCICLLNMNCFGIGYFLTGLKKRGLIALAANLVLIMIGYFTNASRQPALWAIIFLVVFIAMVVDLWLYLGKHPEETPQKFSEKTWLLPVICVVVLVLFYGGFAAYRFTGNKIIDKGEQAYEQDDYLNSYRYLYSADQLYRLSLNPRVVELEPLMDEVSVIVAAQSYSSQSRYQDAIACVDKMHDYYPRSSKIVYMNEFAIDNLIAWADELQASDQYQASYEKYLTALNDYPEEAEGRLDMIDDAIAENYLKWGEYASVQADYENAIEKLEEVVLNYPQSDVFADAYQSAAQAHFDLAMLMNDEEEYYEAFDQLQVIEKEYPEFESMQQVMNEMPGLLIEYSLVIRHDGSLLGALGRLESVAQYTTDTDILARADKEIQETYMQIADDMGDDGAAVIKKAKSQVCDGEIVDHPSVDIYPEEQGTVRACESRDDDFIPAELEAIKPGTFRYVIETEDTDRRVQSCAYTDGFTLERWQSGKKVIVRLVTTGEVFKTKTFYGPSPDPCPDVYTFRFSTQSKFGEDVDAEDVQSWLETVLK